MLIDVRWNTIPHADRLNHESVSRLVRYGLTCVRLQDYYNQRYP